jgi:DNA-binding LacI/PurR family transcriptional regulator
MTKRLISLKDIAAELQVSISTVSRALKNHPDISPALTAKIQALARQWDYSPNPLAMGLLKQQTKIIGVIVPDLVTYFYSSIISGIEAIARQNGYYILITSSYESYEKEKECIENLLASRAEGLIVCLSKETRNYDHFDKIINNEIPLVFFDRVCRTDEVASVVADNREAARKITRHFFESGARRIAHIAGPSHLNIARERQEGYLDGLHECGLKFDHQLLVHTDLSIEDALLAARKLLSLPKPPDAIFSINDMVSFTVLKEIKRQGLNIPKDIMLVGITDEFHATVVDPPLTSVMHPTFDMGQEAARLLMYQSQLKTNPNPLQTVMKTTLVIRESSIKS